jgi:hypothetical protein
MSRLRSLLRWLFVAVFSAMLLGITAGIVGEFFIELGKENGWYDSPSQRLDAAMTALSTFVTQTWFLVGTAFFAGLTVGAWLDHFLRKRGARRGIVRGTLSDQASLRLWFKPNEDAVELSKDNIWRWFAYVSVNINPLTNERKLMSTQIVLTFEEPITPLYRRVSVSVAGVHANVIDFTARSAIISFNDANLENAVVEMDFGALPR